MRMLNSSISKAEQRLNPQAVLDVLNYYSASAALAGGPGGAMGGEAEASGPHAPAPTDKFVSLEIESARVQQFAAPDETEVRVKSGSSSSEFETLVRAVSPVPVPPAAPSQPPPLPAKVFGGLSASKSLGKLAAFASPRKKSDKSEKKEKEKEKEKEREKEKAKEKEKNKQKIKEQTRSIASGNDHCIIASRQSPQPQPAARVGDQLHQSSIAAGQKLPNHNTTSTSNSTNVPSGSISMSATRSVEVAVGCSSDHRLPVVPLPPVHFCAVAADAVSPPSHAATPAPPPPLPISADPTYEAIDELLQRTLPSLPDVCPGPLPLAPSTALPLHSHTQHTHTHSDSSNSLAGSLSPDASASASATSSGAHVSSAASLGSAHKKSSTSINSCNSPRDSRSASQSSGECLGPPDEREPHRSEHDASPTPPPPVSSRPALTKSIVCASTSILFFSVLSLCPLILSCLVSALFFSLSLEFRSYLKIK